MFDFSKFKVKVVEESERRGIYELGPLPRGFGYSLGNPIRRILLTAISGSAVTSVKIGGVKHEYSTMEGLKDDMLHFILNLKNIAVRSYSDEPVTLKLNKKLDKEGSLEITASDFEENSEIEIINKDLVIGTLTKKNASIELEIVIEKGKGYALPDNNKRTEIGVIPLDSIYSPVLHAHFDVVQTRIGDRTDLDQVNLVVHTNGAATPNEVMLEAVEVFDLMANKLVDRFGGDSENNRFDVEEEVEEEETVEKILVSDLDISTRLSNSLGNSGIEELGQLEGMDRDEVKEFKGMGQKSFEELEEILESHNIKLV